MSTALRFAGSQAPASLSHLWNAACAGKLRVKIIEIPEAGIIPAEPWPIPPAFAVDIIAANDPSERRTISVRSVQPLAMIYAITLALGTGECWKLRRGK
jgi:hypothetical protein